MRVITAMSGGVDSSVAALLLKQQSYEVIGISLKLWTYADYGGASPGVKSCCSLESINRARRVCGKLGIPHYTLDFRKEFRQSVVDNFIDEYLSGRTPNPCVRCNTFIKWQALLKYAKGLNVDLIATGHYARIEKNKVSDRWELIRGVDKQKDQSYALWGLSQEDLARTLLPLGNYKKTEVRKIASENDLITAEVPESQEICFIPENNYRKFLYRNVKEELKKIKEGIFIDTSGNKIGEHNGYYNFTIGQRKGLGVAFGKPMYVKKIDPDSNVVTLAEDKELFSEKLTLTEVNWVSMCPDEDEFQGEIQIRYNHKPVKCRVIPEKERIKVIFFEPQRAVTPGQSGVIFVDDRVVLGGIIEGPI